MRIWSGEEGSRTLDRLQCDLCGREITRHLDVYDFVRLHLYSAKYDQTFDVDICEDCVHNKVMPLTLIERDAAGERTRG